MDIELVETLKLIIDRYEGRTQGSVFILMRDFPWYHERNGQLTRLQEAGMIIKPRFYDNGADITLTQAGRHFFDEPEGTNGRGSKSMHRSNNGKLLEMRRGCKS